MKFSTLSSSLVLLSSFGLDGIHANDSSASLRGSNESSIYNRRGLRVQHPCTLVRVETQYEYQLEENFESNREKLYAANNGGGRRRQLQADTDDIKCELQEADQEVFGQLFVNVNGIDSTQLENIVSGDTTIMAEGAMIMDGEMYLPADAQVEFGSNGEENRRLQAIRQQGTKKVLVVRANGQGASTTASAQTLSDKIFGTHGDTATLRSQYSQCSHGKLDLQPYEGTTWGGTYIEDGVLDVTIDMQVPGAKRYAVENAIEAAASQLVGGIRGQFDHVMLCLPPGTDEGQWIAYGYINHWLSVYNDNFCQSMSTQVHEIGHNLGLAHSAKDGVSYGDKSGMMGFSYNRDNGPFICFNPAKNYQLGWFNDKAIEVDPINNGPWAGTIIGIADYSNDLVDQNANVIVKIKTGGSRDYYIGYNRKKWMNSGVLIAGDRVTIIEQGQGYSQSDFLASLTPSTDSNTFNSLSSETFNNFGGSGRNLVVEFVERGDRFDEANIAIYFEGDTIPEVTIPIRATPVPSNPPTLPPLTKAPTNPPTLPPPTKAPTNPPTLPPPTTKPTYALRTRSPRTNPPTGKPTAPPVPSFNIEYNNNNNQNIPKQPKELLNENFRHDLGVFFNSGDSLVTREIFQYVLTAKFPLKNAWSAPSIDNVMDLQGTSTISVAFWYNAEVMGYGEGFKLEYSTTHGNTWKTVDSFVFGDAGFDTVNKWYHAEQLTFHVAQGMSTIQLRFIGQTGSANTNSVFHIAGVQVYGV